MSLASALRAGLACRWDGSASPISSALFAPELHVNVASAVVQIGLHVSAHASIFTRNFGFEV